MITPIASGLPLAHAVVSPLLITKRFGGPSVNHDLLGSPDPIDAANEFDRHRREELIRHALSVVTPGTILSDSDEVNVDGNDHFYKWTVGKELPVFECGDDGDGHTIIESTARKLVYTCGAGKPRITIEAAA